MLRYRSVLSSKSDALLRPAHHGFEQVRRAAISIRHLCLLKYSFFGCLHQKCTSGHTSSLRLCINRSKSSRVDANVYTDRCSSCDIEGYTHNDCSCIPRGFDFCIVDKSVKRSSLRQGLPISLDIFGIETKSLDSSTLGIIGGVGGGGAAWKIGKPNTPKAAFLLFENSDICGHFGGLYSSCGGMCCRFCIRIRYVLIFSLVISYDAAINGTRSRVRGTLKVDTGGLEPPGNLCDRSSRARSKVTPAFRYHRSTGPVGVFVNGVIPVASSDPALPFQAGSDLPYIDFHDLIPVGSVYEHTHCAARSQEPCVSSYTRPQDCHAHVQRGS